MTNLVGLVATLSVLTALPAPAHGGGLNACGCHFNRKTNVCHCHRDYGCGCECQPSRCGARSNKGAVRPNEAEGRLKCAPDPDETILARTAQAEGRRKSYRSSSSGGRSVRAKGYIRKSTGTYVAPSYRTKANRTQRDNYGTKGNVNPYTGKKGTKKARQ
jgi:hypothetical protein